jgi:hypothetical protein
LRKVLGPLAVILTALLCSSAAGAAAYVEKMKAASGGPAWDMAKTLTADGEVTSSGLTGKFHRVEDLATGQFTERSDYEPFAQADGLDADGRWKQDPSRQLHPLDSREARIVTATEAYLTQRGYLFPARVHAFIRPMPSADVDGKRFDLVEITPKDGRIVTLWVDQQTRRLDHVVYQLSTATRTIHYRDYRRVGALTLPFEIVTDEGDAESAETVTISSYQLDAPDAAAELKRPSNQVTDARIASGADAATGPLDLEAGSLLVEAKINGQGPFPFILDTGGHDILTPETAERLGLKPVGKGISRGAGEGTTGIQFTRVDKFSIGDAEVTDQSFLVLPFEYFVTERGKQAPIAGLIGLELFERFAVKLDYAAHQITLSPLDSFTYAGSGTKLPISFTDDMPLAASRLDGHPGVFGIDSGNGGDVVVFSPWAGPIGLVAQFKAGIPLFSFGVGGHSVNYATRNNDLDLGGIAVKDLIARLAEDKAGAFSARSEAGNIGESILSRFTVTFDYRHEIMALEPLAAPAIMAFSRTGLGASKVSPDSFLIRTVYKDGPAAEAGIAAGDTIVAVDGVAATELSGADFYAKARQAVGTQLQLGVVHEGERRDITLTLREVLR